MEKQRGGKKERQRDREMKRKVTNLGTKESLEHRGKEGERDKEAGQQ